MGWTAKDIDELRKGKNGTAGSTAGSSSAHGSTAAGSRSTTGSGWTPEKIDALRGGSTGKRTTEAWVNRSAGTSTETRRARTNTGSSQSGTGGSLGGQVLAQMMGSTNPKLQLEVPGSGTQSERNGTRGGTAQPEWLGKVGSSTPAAQVRGTVKPTEKKRQPYAATGGTMQLQSGYGAVNSAPNADALKQTIAAGDGKRVDWYARTAQEAKEDFAKNSEPDRFDELNQWMDADPKHRELVNLIRGGTGEQQPYVQRGNAMQVQDGTGAMASAPTAQSTGKRDYTDAELQAKGYTQTEINEAKAYIRDFDALPAWQRAVRRTSNTIGGIAEEIAAGGLQMGENAVQAVKNSSVTKKNRDALKESLAGDARQEKLFKLVDTVDSNGSPKYSDAELIAKGYTQGEIDDMRSRYAATEVKDAVDPEKSVGYQLHKRSQDLTGAALSGLSPLAQKALGIVSSAGENLVVASIDPAMVLPVLSLQGAGESMGQSVEKGDSAGKTLAGGALKFGAGWAINSVGAADLAKTMGTDYAKDTLAGKLADLVRSVADNGPLAQQYPVIANAVSGGVDNAMQAFVETYADMAIDAALGDSDAAQNLFKKDTFLNAVESGLTGGASGALGGAVGTGLGKMNAALDAAEMVQATQEAMDAQSTAQTVRSENQAVQQQSTQAAAASAETAAETPAQQAESGQGYSVSLSNDTMTVRFADGTEAVQKVDLEDPKTLLFDPEQLHRQAQAESPAAQQTAVENTGETVESSPAEQHSGLRETYGLTQQSRSTQQRQVQQELTRWKVSDAASETISKNMPVGIGDAERYAAAASSLYRLGQMEDVTTFDKAMELAQGMNGLAVNTEYVLAQDGGRQALQLAWLQGHGEMEAGSMQRGTLGGELTEKSTSGSGRVLYKGTMRTANDVGTQLIELNARATDTDAVLKTVLQGNDRVKAYVDTEVAQIYFADSAEDVFGTILHEDYHWYNSLDAEGAQALQQHALEFLAKSEGYENIDAMIREKAADYAQQGLTYEQAAEELVADAWRGIFSDEASFKRWVEFQRGQAEKNAGKAGSIHKVMTKVKELLSDIVSRAKEVLAKDPENKAALRAQRLAEAEKRVLQDEYFAHAEKAMENLRSAKENAAALKSEGAAEGTRFKLHEDSESLTEQMNDHLDELEEMEPVAEIRGNEVNFGKNARENVENIDAFFDSIGNKVERENFGIVELKHYGANKTVRHGNSAAKQAAVAAIPGVIRNGNQIGYEKNWQGKGYDTYVFAGPVIMDETRINEAVIVNSYTREDGRKAFYTHEVCWSDGSYVTFDDAGKPTKKEDTPTHLPMDVRSSAMAAQEVSSDTSIAQETAENKGNNGTLKKNVRYQLSETDELTKLRDEQQQLDKQRRALKEERSAWLESDAVKAIEAKKKALGIFSAEAKAYRDSEEYQNYLAKRKDYNARMAQLDDQSAALDDRMKAVNARMQQQRAAEGKAEQAAYDAKAEAYGSKAEYRRALAKEQFGTTEDFNRAGYILPDGQMLNFAQNDRTRDTDHREIMSVFGPAEVKTGTEALNEFLLDGNVRVMAEGPGIDLSADTAPTAQQLEQIRQMAQELGSARRQFTLDISTADGRVAASKEYSGRVDADRVVREIRDYYRTGELAQESGLAKFRYQLAEQASRDAKKNDQQTASRAIADKAAALDTLSQFFGLTRGVKVSQSNIEGLASRWAKANGSRVDRAKLARETEVLVEYLKADGADMEKGQALAETLAGEILDGATYRNSELWDEYPELHKLEYTVNKTGQAKAELVKAYGSWSAAVAEARKHGVSLRQAEGVRDGNPVEQYDSVINDNRAVGGTSDGAKALWKAAAQQAGVDGAMSMESTEWLNVLMNLHDAIKPATQSRFADDAEYEDAKVELAGRIIGDILNTPEMTDAQAIFEGIQQHNLQVAKAAAGSEERAAEVEKGLKGVQKAQ